MKNIKAIYWIFCFVFSVITACITIIASQESWSGIVLSGVAIIISIVAMGLSDQKKHYFKGEIKVWSMLLNTKTAEENSFFRVSMQILNLSTEPVYDIVYRMRLPSNITQRMDEKNSIHASIVTATQKLSLMILMDS